MLSMPLISSRTHFAQRGKKNQDLKFITGEGPVAGGFQVRTPGWGRVEAKGGRPFWNRVGPMCRGVRFGPTTATPSGDEANALPEHPDAVPEHQGACMQRRRKGQPGALKPSAGRAGTVLPRAKRALGARFAALLPRCADESGGTIFAELSIQK